MYPIVTSSGTTQSEMREVILYRCSVIPKP